MNETLCRACDPKQARHNASHLIKGVIKSVIIRSVGKTDKTKKER